MEASRGLLVGPLRERSAGGPGLIGAAVTATFSRPLAQFLAVAVLVVALSTPLLFISRPAALTSDESLYLAEGLNIAQGKGLTYPWGDLINHRGPLLPAVLAADFKVLGTSLGSAYLVPKVVALVNALLLFLLGRRLFGPLAGGIAAVLAAGSSYLNGAATTLYVDAFQTMFLLTSMLLLSLAAEGRGWALYAVSGAALGLAFLAKESAMLWLPLPFLSLLLGRPRGGPGTRAFAIVAFVGGVALTSGWWWAWVYAVTGRIYLVGNVAQPVLALSLLVAIAMVASLAVVALSSRRRPPETGRRWPRVATITVALALLVAWDALFLYGLERTGWPFPIRYHESLPDYFRHVVAPAVRPFYLMLAAWAFLAYRAVRGSQGALLVCLGLALFAPFAIFTANRFLQVRDMMPVIYLSYLALGALAAASVSWALQQAREAGAPGSLTAAALAGLVVVAAAFLYSEARSFRDANEGVPRDVATQDNWDNPLVHRTAAWMEESIPAGASVLSTRLYYSHLYFLTGGRYSIRQLPTVRVEVDAGSEQPLRRVSTLFRWEEHRLVAPRIVEDWIYVRRYPLKLYYIALSERDLLEELRAHQTDYLVLSTEDAGFSSLSYLHYLMTNPGFTLRHVDKADEGNRVYIFKVDGDRLEALRPAVTMDQPTLAALLEEAAHAGAAPSEFLRAVAPHGVRVWPPASP